jgi:hypothetical protein
MRAPSPAKCSEKPNAALAGEQLVQLGVPIIEPLAPNVRAIDSQQVESIEEHAGIAGATSIGSGIAGTLV